MKPLDTLYLTKKEFQEACKERNLKILSHDAFDVPENIWKMAYDIKDEPDFRIHNVVHIKDNYYAYIYNGGAKIIVTEIRPLYETQILERLKKVTNEELLDMIVDSSWDGNDYCLTDEEDFEFNEDRKELYSRLKAINFI